MVSDYREHVFDALDAQQAADWMALCYPSGADSPPPDPFMDLRFVAALQGALAESAKFWMVMVYDGDGRLAACACLTLYRVDGAVLAGEMGRRPTEFIRRGFPGYLKFKVLLCGLPISAGQSSLRIRADADASQVVAALDRALHKVARETGARITAIKEFDRVELDRASDLKKLGYLCADSLPMNLFEPRFNDFDEVRAALKAHYRSHFKKSERKFAAAGLRMETTTDTDRILQVYTPHVHRLYHAVESQARHRFEQLPHDFFCRLARQFPGDVSLTLAWRGDEVAGFDWGLSSRGVFCNLFVGIDYAINNEADLYFNLMMHNLDHALRRRPAAIFVGQSADQFKSRLGCHQEPRYFFVKARGWLLASAMRLGRGLIFPASPPPQPQRDLFGVRPARQDPSRPLAESARQTD